jgi:sodium pump decarboxylase gamma subunit
VALVTGSRSTYLRGGFGGFEGRALRQGDLLAVGPTRLDLFSLAGRSIGADLLPEELSSSTCLIGRTILDSTFLQGLWITVVGMGLVFLALGILVLAMMALERLFRPKAKGTMATETAEEPSKEEEEIVAIAVALASLLTEKEAQVGYRQLGSALGDGPGSWSVVGRGQQLRMGRIRGHE